MSGDWKQASLLWGRLDDGLGRHHHSSFAKPEAPTSKRPITQSH